MVTQSSFFQKHLGECLCHTFLQMAQGSTRTTDPTQQTLTVDDRAGDASQHLATEVNYY
jgi:hypothetical protein